ncbi:MAG: 4-hydroxy-tetrahydrodipicolinate synthase [Deltaproteobacteria bacterium]|nr:4-hydroxy-tetrahydrodipicolinate synthase [Deltaproteobacteria bacterium]
MKKLEGVWPAIVTPLARDGSVDHDALATFCGWMIDEGVTGLVACGTTGEGATMDEEETLAITRTVTAAADGRVPVIVGTGSNDTRRSVQLTEKVAALGVEAALVVTPYYNKPNADGLELHYRAVAEVGLPVVLYNVPGRTGTDMSREVIVRLAALEGVVAIKDASRSMEKAMELRDQLGPDFSLLSGDDFTILPFLACGGDGVISVIANVAPRQTVALVKAFQAGELEQARRLQTALLPLIGTLFLEANPIPVKGLLAELGRMGPTLRAPLAPASAKTLAAARAAYDALEETA